MILTDNPVFAVGMMLAGLTAGMIWYGFRLKKAQKPVSAALFAAAFGSLLALICAKAGYLLHDLGANILDGYYDEITAIRPDTLSFAGGCAGFIAGTALAAKVSVIRPAEALDLFAAPGCLFLCLARIAEGGMDTVGMGNEVEAAWLRFFPLTMQNSWGDAYLSVFVLEALTALVCLIPALRQTKGTADPAGFTAERIRQETKQDGPTAYIRKSGNGAPDGLIIERTAVCLLGTQIGWEMLLQYPYLRTFVTSFVSLEQVLCAVFLMILVVRGCVRGRRWWPVPATLLLLCASTFFQFFRDNKIEFLFEEGWEWALDSAQTISLAAFFLISAALIRTGLKAVAPGSGKKA